MSDDYRPLARQDGLLVERVDDELLVFDGDQNHAHVLTPSAARLWELCDGTRCQAELQEESGLEADTVQLALAQLQERGLLAQPAPPGISRRGVLRAGAIAGAGVGLGAPLIRSIVAPTPAMATSPGPGPTGATGPGPGPTGATGPTGSTG
jgi:hypothetical protein